MKKNMKLTIACLLLTSAAIAQSSFNQQLAFEGSHLELNEKIKKEEKISTFDAKYHNHKIYFTSEFGTDNRVVIDIYSLSGEFVMSIQATSKNQELKQFVWNDYEKLQYKLNAGAYKAIFNIKGKESREVVFTIN